MKEVWYITNIFLTGDIQVGKSTILNSFLLKFPGIIGGFKTEPYFTSENEKVFVLSSFNSFTGKKSEKQYICKPSKTSGRLVSITQTFEDFGVKILEECLEEKPNIIIMDELGIFESDALNFQESVYKCISSPIPVIGVIKNKESNFLNELRSRNNVVIMAVSLENRELQRIRFNEYCGKLLTTKIE